MNPTVPLLLASAVSDGATLTNTVTATSILHGSGKPPVAGGALSVGSILKARIWGAMGVGAAGAGNITFDMRIGGTVVTSSGLILLRTNSCSSSFFMAEIGLTVTSLGTAAGGVSYVTFDGIQAIGATVASTPPQTQIAPSVGPSTSPNNWDATVNGAVDVFGTWSVATTGDTLIVRRSEIWLLG